ncbi:MAG: sulfate/molybdate ABC transporter ATP-binding protein [Syntrophomonadaceae bacterium]|nr:sulfate/molybdate ABC transporter ATP-binding protein [Syntrophomonadaceae bacterium]
MGLYIDIIKKLAGFRLQVKLSCEQDIIGVLGASGAGKSMLLKCIAGLITPDEGKIILNGRTFFDSAQKINLPPKDRRTGFLFQNYALFPHMTIAENIAFSLSDLSKSAKNKRVAELMERFRLTDLADMEKRYPAQISGGQQQRVALARAMAVEPEILLLDEPFSALDDTLRIHMMKEMLAYLKEFQGCTLYITHNIEEAYRLCNRIAIINNGSLEAFGLKRDLFQTPVSFATAKITGCKNISPAIQKSSHTLEVPDWGGIQVKTKMNIESGKGFVGIRANHIKLADDSTQENCFSVWIADESEAPFRTTLFLKIGSKPCRLDDYHLQWEVSHDQRNAIRQLTQPIRIYMPPGQVFFVQN